MAGQPVLAWHYGDRVAIEGSFKGLGKLAFEDFQGRGSKLLEGVAQQLLPGVHFNLKLIVGLMGGDIPSRRS